MKIHCTVAASLACWLALDCSTLIAQGDGILNGTIRKIDRDGLIVTLPVDGKDRDFLIREETRVFGAEKLPLAERLKGFKVGDEVYFKPAQRDGKDVLVGIKHFDNKGPAAKAPMFDASKLKPLPALAGEKYQGFAGGLYPDGNRRPEAHEKAGLERAARIVPLDAAGKPDPNGKIVLVSIGMSNTSQASQAFARALAAETERNPHLVFVNGAQGGMTAAKIANPEEPRFGAPYWKTVDERLKAAGVTPAQVQAVWIKQADAGPSQGFPKYAQTLHEELTAIVRLLPGRFPNVRSAYLSSRVYAGHAKTGLNPEPYAFESGFSVKWLIEAQIKGDPALALDKTPWLSWGPYLWDPSFREADFAADGTHHSPAGSDKIAAQMLAFFKTDPTTRGWFLRAK